MNQKILKDDIAIWVENYTQELYSWASHKVSDSELAADLVQDTFLAASKKIDSFKNESSPKTWLFSILNNKIIDHYRKKIKQPVQLESQSFLLFFSEEGDWRENRKPKNWLEEDNEPNLLDDHEFQNVLNKCLDALPDQWGICVKLKYLSEKRGDEICQELEISASNYWQIIHRAKLQLRECVEKNWFN